MINFTQGALRSNFKIMSKIYGNLNASKSLSKQTISTSSISLSMKTGSHKPNTLEKYLLVWMKKYPSVSEVPSTVSADMMEKTRNWARIKINIIACVLTAVACGVMVYSGKQAAKRGESVQKMNIQWHEEENKKK